MIRMRTPLTWLLCLLAAAAAFAQTALPVRQQQPSANWVPEGIEVLGQRAAFHTDFTFDHSMLQLAGNFLGGDDPQTRSAIGKLDSITVHSYHFAAPGLYDPAALDQIRRQCEALGWRHLVTARAKGDPFNPGRTDLWINFAHMDVTGMMVLVTGSRDLNLIALNGDLSTVDLLHLRGHFGIPRFSGDRFVPPSGQPRQPYVSPSPEPAPEQMPDQPQDQDGSGVGVGVGGDTPEVEPAPPPPVPPGI
jgi:hypothetical protein